MKAHLPRSEARRPKKAKAGVRPSSVDLKKSPPQAVTAKPVELTTKPHRNGVVSSKQPTPAAAKATGAKAPPATNAPALARLKAATVKLPAPASTTLVKPGSSGRRATPLKVPPVTAAPVTATKVKTKPAKPAAVKAAPAKAAPAKVAPVNAAPAPAKKPTRKSIKEAAGVSTDAVARRTGKTWDDWFEVLDSAGAATLDQRGIVAILAQKHGIGPWWQQMIAVGYESLRGKSDKPAAVDGFQINSSCTLDAPVTRVFRLWHDSGERARWLADDRFIVRGATADKLIRARWGKGNSHVAVSFSEKAGRTEVNVDHQQIESRGAAEQMKAYWAKKLGLLGDALTPRRP